jgi:hypothetical protein
MNTSKSFAILLFILFNVFPSKGHGQTLTISNHPITFQPQKTSNGLIFGSLSFPKEKAKFNGYFLKVQCISTDSKIARKNSKEISFSPKQIFKMQHKGELDQGLTYLFQLELPEGEYEISGIRLFSNSGIAVLQRNDFMKGFSIPFTLKKGQIRYVGNINFDEYAEKDKQLITYKNEFQKDFDAIKINQPYVFWNNPINDTLEISYK